MRSRLTLFFVLFAVVSGDFIVLSDLHYDPHYTVNAPTNCPLGQATGMKCCRPWDFGTGSAWPNGTINCDSSVQLVQAVLSWVNASNVDYAVFLGDVVDHDLLIQNWSYNMRSIQFFADLWNSLVLPHIALLGNHDSYIVDNLWNSSTGQAWMKEVATIYDWPSPYGYFRYNNSLFLNSLPYDRHNLYPLPNMFNQSTWWSAQQNVDKIFTHFPFTSEADYEYQRLLNDTKANTVLAGHTHVDDIAFTATGLVYVHSSIVPDKHWPMFRLYNEQDGTIVDYTQWGVVLPSLEILPVYTARADLGLKDLSRQSWQNFVQELALNSTLQNRWNCWRYWRGQQC